MDGFIPLEEFYNVMTEWMRRIDEEIWPRNQPVMPRDVFISHCDALKFDVAKRAKGNMEDATKRNKIAVKTDEATKAKDEASAAANKDEWRRRTQMGRDAAKRGI